MFVGIYVWRGMMPEEIFLGKTVGEVKKLMEDDIYRFSAVYDSAAIYEIDSQGKRNKVVEFDGEEESWNG